jgi:hypothetical protein
MYETTPSIYLKVGTMLMEQIGTRDFFSGSVELCDGDVECRLLTTLVVSRDSDDDGIVSLHPVWWEFTTTLYGEELCNDFSFNEMLKNVY